MGLHRWGTFAAAGAMLAGCTVGPDYHAPAVPMPAGFAASATPAKAPAQAKDAAVVDLESWWRSLGDHELESLVDRAVASNLDIEIALTRLQEARTEEAVVLGMALPEAEASGGGGLGTGSDLSRNRAAPALSSGDHTSGLRRVSSVVGFDAGWELDIFGKYRREIEAAGYDTQAAMAARNEVLVAVIGDVVRAYVDLRGLQMQLAVLNQNLDTAARTVTLVQTRFDRGLTNELDVALAKRELATLQAEVAPYASEISAARDTIAVLIGRFPEDLAQELTEPGMIPPLPVAIAPGLPPDLLRRRPDVSEAERQLASATARIGVATANLFPHLALTAAVGYQQGSNAGVLRTAGIWSVGPTAYWSLLDFGTLDALVDIADLETHERLVEYKETILQAVQQVDTAIADYGAQQDRLGHLTDALAAARYSVTLATQRYDRGLTDFLNVLDAERQEYDLENQYAVAEQAAGDDFVALYKGLGGGWESYQSIPPIRTPQPAVVAAFRRLLAPDDPTK